MCTTKILLFSINILSFILLTSSAVDLITETQTIKDGEVIVSSDGTFAMGFFTPGKSKYRYVGIWYNKVNVTTTVWVANREIPLYDSLGKLKVIKPGILVILNSTNEIIWSSNTSISVTNPVAQLLDSGNLVIKNASDEFLENIIWQSFDYPGNTLLDGMKVGKNFLTGKEWYITSWKSEDDPSPGDHTFGIDTRGYPQVFLWTRSTETCRAGLWIGDRFSGSSLEPSSIYRYTFFSGKDEVNFTFLSSSTHPRRILNHTGVTQWWLWAEKQTSWKLYAIGSPHDLCDYFKICGAYGSCNIYNSPICTCLDKFVAKSPESYSSGDWSAGCVRRTHLNCQKGDIFLKYSGLKLPDTRNVWFDSTMTLEKCRYMCLRNCSCTAYSSMDFTRGSGCFLWFEELIDIRSLSDGQDIYIRMSSYESETKVSLDHKSPEKIIVSLTLALGGLLCLGLTLYVWKRKHLQMSRKGYFRNIFVDHSDAENHSEDLILPMFKLEEIREATNNFSESNKLGEGGYGPVYKGVLKGRQEIAVKRLSSCSTQGLEEFKNEVLCIAKHQHKNLVKLLGCCVEEEEKMLIYEYMPNKSLNYFIFDETQSRFLDWPKCFNIINGISRGILYLHQDSRLRIIHRDLKASNVLLDIDMNPKICDFGIARIFGSNETEANTCRVVGTYGYMSPEYQMDGIFSTRSDVFSFGVLVLEIVTRKKNRGFFHPDHNHNLLGHAWMLYNEGRSLELIDANILDSDYIFEIMRSIHVALLCVQQYPEDRPSMSSVVLMLSSDHELPQPKQPGFFTERKPLEAEFYTSKEPSSPNEVTISLLYAR